METRADTWISHISERAATYLRCRRCLQLVEEVQFKLAAALKPAGVPLIVVRMCGLVGLLRVGVCACRVAPARSPPFSRWMTHSLHCARAALFIS